jgi:mono/diheme cytochrome c family protein
MKVVVALIFIGFFLVIPAPAQSQLESMPEGEGRSLVSGVCAACHTLDRVLTLSNSRGDWEKMVQDMVSRGAQISSEEVGAIVNYLAEHYGENSRPASLSQSAQDVFNSQCFQCHTDTMWKNLRRDRKEWTGILYRMVGRGALWTEEEINTMAEYLATTRGRSDD